MTTSNEEEPAGNEKEPVAKTRLFQDYKHENWIKDHPEVSTWLAAAWLSICWIFVWLTIFFFTTLFLGLQTGLIAFVMTLWLSILAEAYIRYLENTDKVAKYSKPKEVNPTGDNQDFTKDTVRNVSLKGIIILLVVVVGLVLSGERIMGFTPHPDQLKFEGQILVDRGDLIFRTDKCKLYKDANSFKVIGLSLIHI